jgi:hypothetical protein
MEAMKAPKTETPAAPPSVTVEDLDRIAATYATQHVEATHFAARVQGRQEAIEELRKWLEQGKPQPSSIEIRLNGE